MKIDPNNHFKIIRNNGTYYINMRTSIKIPALILSIFIALSFIFPIIGLFAIAAWLSYYCLILLSKILYTIDQLPQKNLPNENKEVVNTYNTVDMDNAVIWSHEFILNHVIQSDHPNKPVDISLAIEDKKDYFMGEIGFEVIQDKNIFGIEVWLFDKEDYIETYLGFICLAPKTDIPSKYKKYIYYFSGNRSLQIKSEILCADITLGDIKWDEARSINNATLDNIRFKELPITVTVTLIKK